MKDFAKKTGSSKRLTLQKIRHSAEATGVLTFFKSLIFFVSAGFIAISGGYIIYAAFQPIKDMPITIRGNEVVSETIITDLLAGDALLLKDLDTYELKVLAEQFIWIKEANFKIHYPAYIEVEITERKPIAFYRTPSHIFMLDEDLMVLPNIHNPKGWDLPVIYDGNVSGLIRTGEMIRYPTLTAAIELMGILAESDLFSLDMIAEIDVTDFFDIKVSTYGQNFLIHFGYNQFQNKLKNLYYTIPEIKQMDKASVIDLRYGNKVIVK